MRKALLAVALWAIPSLAQAQGVPIQDLPLATTPLSSSDLFAVAQGNVFHKLPGTSLGLAAGLGTMSTQNANAVAITGGTISGVTIAGNVTGHASLDLALAGGTMLGNIAMGGNDISGGGMFAATTLTGTLSTAAQPNITSVGTLAGLTVTGSFTATGLVSNADIANPATTVNGQTCTLGSTCTVTAAAGNALTFGTHLTGGSFNGSAPVTLGTDATSANTVSTIVARDGSGNFAAGAITLTGNPVYAVSGLTANGNCVEFGTGSILTDTGAPCSSGGGGGSVTSVGLTVPATSIFGVTGSPITTAGTLGITTTGTSGGIPYFSSTSQLTSSALLASHGVVYGGGAGSAPVTTAAGTNGQILTGQTGAAPAFETMSGDGTFSAAGVLAITNLSGVTNASLANSGLAHSTISGVSLGSNLATLTYGTHLTNSAGASTYNGSAASTLATDATNANTASTIVARDASGNFTAGTITATLTGGASLDLPLTGGTMSGDIAMGGHNISGGGTVTATTLAGTLSTAAQPNITSVGTLAGLTVTGSLTATGLVTNADLAHPATTVNGQTCTLGSTCTVTATAGSALTFGTHLTGTSYNGSSPVTIATDATDANTNSTIVARDGSGNFTAGTITASLIGGPVDINIGNYVADTSPFRTYFPTIASSSVAAVLGSTGSPDLTLNYAAVFQKVGTQSTNQEIGGAVLGSLIATGTGNFAHSTAVVGYAQSNVSVGSVVNSPFIEGTRGQCNLIAPGQNTQCNGVSGEVNMWTPYSFAIGVESADNNYTGVDLGSVINTTNFDTSFLASCGDHGVVTGHKPCQIAFFVNPNSEDVFHYGLYIPSGAVDTAAIDIEGSPPFAIHMPSAAAGGFNLMNDGSVDIGVYHVTTDAAIRFYEAGGDHTHWDQAIQGTGGSGLSGTPSGSLLFHTPAAIFTGTLAVTPTIALTNTAYTSAFSSMYSVATVSGVINHTNTITPPTGFTMPVNYDECSDTATFSGAAPIILTCREVYQHGIGTGTGDRVGLQVDMSITGSATQTEGNAYINGIIVTTAAASNLGGIAGAANAIGDVYGVSTQTQMLSGATFYASVHGAGEWDLSVATGASVSNKIGAEISLLANDAVQGSNMDVALLFTSNGSGTWKRLINLGFPSGQGGTFPMAAAGTILGSFVGGSTATGIDFGNITFSNCAVVTANNCMKNTGLAVGSQNLIGGTTLTVHTGTDQNLTVSPHVDLSDGIVVDSLNDAANAFKGFEINASAIILAANSTISGTLNLPGITGAANCAGQPSGNVIATTGTGVLIKCP